jgi:hypothetical protein
MKTMKRCDAIVLQLIVTEYDEHGRPVGEMTSAPVKVFRGVVHDVWAEADKAAAAIATQQKTDALASPPPTKGAKKR